MMSAIWALYRLMWLAQGSETAPPSLRVAPTMPCRIQIRMPTALHFANNLIAAARPAIGCSGGGSRFVTSLTTSGLDQRFRQNFRPRREGRLGVDASEEQAPEQCARPSRHRRSAAACVLH